MRLAVFPLLQALAFVVTLRAPNAFIAAAAFAVLLAAMCLTLHVTAHERVHQPPPRGRAALEALLSPFIGLPFSGYAFHHWNHHRHVNSIGDFSSTWRDTPLGPRPRPAILYALGWPSQLRRSWAPFRAHARATAAATSSLRREQLALGGTLALFVLLDARAILLWLVMVYVGWALIALHNYGQHPPIEYGAGETTTFAAPAWNALTCNNGLHAEHHAEPAVPWADLTPRDGMRRIALPPAISALLRPPLPGLALR